MLPRPPKQRHLVASHPMRLSDGGVRTLLQWGLCAALGAALPACGPGGPPAAEVRLCGAQFATEIVESWLAAAQPAHFRVTKVWPLHLSQHGFQSLAKGECDLACVERPLERRELEQFTAGDTRSKAALSQPLPGGERRGSAAAQSGPPHGVRVAFFGYGLYVHPDNPVDAIRADQLKAVLQKRVKNWRTIAGRTVDFSGDITVYGLGKSTRNGAHLSHMARIFMDDPSWTVLESDQAVIDAVAKDVYGLGFASIGFDHGVRYLGLRMDRTGPAAVPSIEAIEAERYGLAKVIYVYYRDPASPAVTAALDYLFSDAGRKAIEGTELWAIDRSRAEVPLP